MLSRSRVYGMIRRHGSDIEWYHALPTDESTLNPLTLEPKIAVGGVRPSRGPMGENYLPPITIRAYLSNKISEVYAAQFGVAEIGDYQLTLALPFGTWCCVAASVPGSVQGDYNEGNFFVAQRDRTPRTDKFSIEGAWYTVKAKPVPILDHNSTIAWRLLVKKFEY